MNTTVPFRVLAAAIVLCAGSSMIPQAEAKPPRTVAREVCRDEVVKRVAEPKDKDQVVGTAVGAVIGGVLGNQVGSGDGKKLATVGGAVAGGYAGNRIQENNQDRRTVKETRRVCRTLYEKL